MRVVDMAWPVLRGKIGKQPDRQEMNENQEYLKFLEVKNLIVQNLKPLGLIHWFYP
jgi:hypothetical protein